jgi:uncharacterized protein
MNIAQHIAQELSVDPARVEAAIALLNEGATVPFIARYRKEATGGLDDTQLRRLEERLGYLTELEARRASVLSSIEEQGKLSPELKREILAAETKTRLEDLYRPYMKKRRTKAQVAREAGLEPLARGLSEDPSQVPETLAADFVDPAKGIADTKAALEGARQILMEDFAEDAELVGNLRRHLEAHAILRSRLMSGKGQVGAKFSDYFEYEDPLRRIPSHRALALFRGRKEGILGLSLVLPEDEQGGREAGGPSAAERRIAAHFRIHDRGRPADAWLRDTVRWAWRVKISLRLELDLLGQLRERAEAEAIGVFGKNLNDLLLAAPAGPRTTMGLDPGLRTGVKVAVVDATGRVLDTATIYPHPPKKRWNAALDTLAGLARKHAVELVSIGNGTASRETERLVAELIRRHPELGLTRLVVSEAGASVYSASETAAREFPDLDVSLRGAVSIARRLQDPLAELVKIEPKSIGVGQYQHDVAQTRLARTLEAVVEDCVTAVGVDVNTASAPLLTRVAGLSATLADNIVQYRDQSGAFRNRRELLKVPRLGKKAFEQSAGFLRIAGGDNPLDASAVHPEAYPVVERISRATAREVEAMIGEGRFLQGLCPADYTDERFGEPTVRDILAELEKPGRDPRPEFRTAAFQDGVEAIGDLKPGMLLEGVVTNVTSFGAFVDIGVHQDGLAHISALSERFVKDPREVVKAGQVVKVKVMNVDLERRRIGLSMRLNDDPRNQLRESGGSERGRDRVRSKPAPEPEPAKPTGAMAEAFARLRR